MAKYQITPRPDGLRIDVSDAAGKQAAILKALQECKEGRCSCPTPEYDKLAATNVTAMPNAVRVELTTKPGAELQTEAVRKCLDFTIDRLARDVVPPGAHRTGDPGDPHETPSGGDLRA